MPIRICLVVLLFTLAQGQETLVIKRVAYEQAGPRGSYQSYGCVVDSDHDGWLEYIYQCGYDTAIPGYHWNVTEYRPVNRFELVKSDTGIYPPPPGQVMKGLFWPLDAGDVDRDGKTDLVGSLYGLDSTGRNWRTYVCTIESRDSASYPDSLDWADTLPGTGQSIYHSRFADLDRDGRAEIIQPWLGTNIYENVGDDRESLVYSTPPWALGRYPVADFDMNGTTDFAFAGAGVRVFECTADNWYEPVCSLSTGYGGGSDVWLGHDVDQNGRPEFFVSFYKYAVPESLLLYMFEATGPHEYAYHRIDTARIPAGNGSSVCVDLDGDSTEEVVWSCYSRVIILKATGPHTFRRATTWHLDLGCYYAACNAGDFNGNGYTELTVGGLLPGSGGATRTSFLEVEAVRVLHPDTLAALNQGDTCLIRWRVYTPPRCDSVSLFLKTDTTIYPPHPYPLPNGGRGERRGGDGFWRLDTIATGLPSSDSIYAWVVPETTLSWAKIVAIAYGPGWQFDESDSAFSIVPSGVAEALPRPRDWALVPDGSLVLDDAAVVYDVPLRCALRLVLYDAGGRLVETLDSGVRESGRYRKHLGTVPAGIYYIRLDAPGFRDVRKLVLVR